MAGNTPGLRRTSEGAYFKIPKGVDPNQTVGVRFRFAIFIPGIGDSFRDVTVEMKLGGNVTDAMLRAKQELQRRIRADRIGARYGMAKVIGSDVRNVVIGGFDSPSVPR